MIEKSLPDETSLNTAQTEAVSHRDGPLLVLAGAGTGKTRVLTHRVAEILRESLIPAYRLLCVTFTNKAAREMRERIEVLVPEKVEGLWLGTFHGLAVRVLRRHAVELGIDQDFMIVDSDDQHRLLRGLMQEMRLDPKQLRPSAVMPYLQGWKDRALKPERVPENEHDALDGLAIELYRSYQARLQSLNACDFGDLLLYNIELFAHQPDILQHYQERFRYILVDEYQDTNFVQNLWLSLLAHRHRQLCCVGDDDQSIYGWRGAEIRNILEFQQRFPEATVIRLEENYRSTQNILDAATGVIAHNRGRLGKQLRATQGAGEPVGLRGFWDSRAEARAIADEINKRHYQGVGYDSQAILIRASHVSQMLETTFAETRIPYRIYGGLRFYEREEIRDAVAYLRLIQRADDDLACARIINKPTRGIGQTTQDKLRSYAESHGVGMLEAARRVIAEGGLSARAVGSLEGFLRLHADWRERMTVLEASDLLHEVLQGSGTFDYWRASGKLEAEGKLENLGELQSAIAEFADLATFLEHVALVMDDDRDNSTASVAIMTIHAAKGLEFDDVFLPAWEEGIFPNPRSIDEGDGRGLEEERRLAYVGITRAKRRVEISFARERFMHGQVMDTGASRFLRELPEGCLRAPLSEIMAGLGSRWSADSGVRRRHQGERPMARVGLLKGGAHQSVRPTASVMHGGVLGRRCRHVRFGDGTITAEESQIYVIEFDNHGQKKIRSDFVRMVES